MLYNNGDAFEISIDRECDDEGKSVYDDSVSSTIIHILTTNIEAKGDTSTFFFVCDTTDGDGKLRARKFNMWFGALRDDLPELEKYNFILAGFEGEEFNVSLLIFSNHPNKEDYINAFEKYLTDNFNKS